MQHGAERDARHDDARDAADGREQQRLDEELSNERAALGADRESNRDFFAAVARLREEEAREIGARDEQHESDDDHQRRRGGHDDGVEQRIDGDRPSSGMTMSDVPVGQFAGYALRHVRREALGHGRRLRLSTRPARAAP